MFPAVLKKLRKRAKTEGVLFLRSFCIFSSFISAFIMSMSSTARYIL